MSKNLLIVFTKNIELGKVKTRLAKSIGDAGALEIYKQLVDITENATLNAYDTDLHIYYTNAIDDNHWQKQTKFIQVDGDLGAKMGQAFEYGFNLGYNHVIGIGSDLPEISSTIIKEGFEALKNTDTVFGPATDGGYYLLGMNGFHSSVFENKPWSTSELLKVTMHDLENTDRSIHLLQELNDVDTIEDLEASSLGN